MNLFSSPYSNWFNFLHDFIADDGKDVYVPDFPIGVDIKIRITGLNY